MCRTYQVLPVILATLMLLAIFPPITPDLGISDEQEAELSPSLNQGTGRDLIGDTLNIAGTEWEVNSEIGLDYWQDSLIQSGTSVDGLDIVVGEDEDAHLCWTSISEGTVHYAKIFQNGTFATQLVDSEIISDNRSGDCAISLTPYNKVRMMYWDGPDLRMAREALGGIFWYPTWMNRTIIEDVKGDSIELETTSDSREIAVFRDGDHRLWKAEFNAAYWVQELLDSGPVGEDFELELDSEDVMRLLYYHPDSDEIRLIRGNGTEIDRKVVAKDSAILGNIGMGLTSNDLEQMAYSIESAGGTDIEYAWSIADENLGRVEPSPSWFLSGDSGNAPVADIEVFDIDGDGDLEILIADGSGIRVHQNKSGPAFMILNGTSVEKGDFDGDGDLDLAIADKNWNSSRGRVSIYEMSNQGVVLNETWAVFNGSADAQLGITLTSLGDVDNDGDDELAMLDLADPSADEDEIVRIAYGTSEASSFIVTDNITATGNGPYFGRSIIGGGDLNGDGKSDMVVSNTGTISSPLGYSSFEVFLGKGSGLSTTPDSVHQSSQTGRLFAASIAFAGDVDGDGDDELLVGEIFNNSNVYQGGKLWYFTGSNSGLKHVPNQTLMGSSANDRIGYSLAAAGDVNEDGWDDFLVMSDLVDGSGSVDLYLGSENGPDLSSAENIVSGDAGDKAGRLMLAGFDVESDGLNELMFTIDDDVVIHTERDWVVSSYSVGFNISDFSLKTPVHSSPVMMAIGQTVSLREWSDEGSSGGLWLDRIVPGGENTSHDITKSGRTIYATLEGDSLIVRQARGNVLLSDDVLTTSGYADKLATEVDANGFQRSVFTQNSAAKLWYSAESSGSWQNEVVVDGTGSVDYLDIHSSVQSTNIAYLDRSTDKIMLATNGSSWTNQELLVNQAIGNSMASAMDGEDVLFLLDSNVSGSEALTLVRWNGTNITSQIIDPTTGSETLDLEVDSGLIHLTARIGDIVRITSISGNVWVNQTVNIDQPEMSELQFALPWLSVPGLNGTGLLMKWNGTGWQEEAHLPEFMDDGVMVLASQQTATLLYFDANSRFMLSTLNDNGLWYDSPTALNPDVIAISAEHSRVILRDSTSADLVAVRLESDLDRDMVPDVIDELPLLANQWTDSDSDGFGDNQDGPFYDECNSQAGTSVWKLAGCPDYDGDLVADSIDNCVSDFGTSWYDRFGCPDQDLDGWSSNGGNWILGDRFPLIWKQSLDTDGDGVGDNHGPDCCNTSKGDKEGDLFPYNRHQWKDSDGDGYGDNESHFASGDQCPDEAGSSWRDRNGCLDSDGDGASDPSGMGTFFEWGFDKGADRWKNDPTQWSDSDGDGYGDNSSDLANNPDKFPTNPAAANDSDGDGYPDEWTELYNGTNSGGLELDYCPDVFGDSTIVYKGCLDSDDDGWADLGDAFPFESTQQLDSDGDGFGNNLDGFEGDVCPEVFGYANGTDGRGCPNELDSDSDGILDDFDDCASTPLGEVINATGCSQSQIDDDGDSIMNSDDYCPNSPQGESVDSKGCTDAQNQVDSDGDGVNDPLDDCANTPEGETVDENGCSEDQADDDNDGVANSIDECPDSQPGASVDEVGCVDVDADSDGDGFNDGYSFDLNESTGLRDNQTGDAFPDDVTQWSDLDGDGFGDNPAGNLSDMCPQDYSLSLRGCPDSDEDGYEDFKDPFPNDSTQWEDKDADGVGDNPDGNNPDKCLGTPKDHPVNAEGCSTLLTDSDGDGVVDAVDECPNQGKHGSIDAVGCPLDDGKEVESEGIFGLSTMQFFGYGLGGLVGLLLVLVILVRLLRGGDDWDLDDDDDEEDEDDWYEETTSFGYSSASSPYTSTQPTYGEVGGYGSQSRGPPSRGPPGGSPSERGPPSRGPPSRGPPGVSPSHGPSGGPPGGPSRGPPGGPSRGPPGGPSRGSPGGPSRGPPGGPSRTPAGRNDGDFSMTHRPVNPSVPRKQVQQQTQASEQQGVRRRRVVAAPAVDHDLFSESQQAAKQAAIDWTRSALNSGSDERSVLMQLQETGWGAQQSRAIITLSTQ